jgi:hypothetical protein
MSHAWEISMIKVLVGARLTAGLLLALCALGGCAGRQI